MAIMVSLYKTLQTIPIMGRGYYLAMLTEILDEIQHWYNEQGYIVPYDGLQET
jgi:hypothetical protein